MSVCCWWCSPGEFSSMVCRRLIKAKKPTTWTAPPGLFSRVLRNSTPCFVGRSIRPSIHWSFTLHSFCLFFWVFGFPAHPHSTGVAVYPALFIQDSTSWWPMAYHPCSLLILLFSCVLHDSTPRFVCPSVCPSVRPLVFKSVSPLVCHTLLFWRSWDVLATPPHNWGSR